MTLPTTDPVANAELAHLLGRPVTIGSLPEVDARRSPTR